MRPLSEFAELRDGNHLVIMQCQGKHQCAGYIRIPFRPTINGAPDSPPAKNSLGQPIWWNRTKGSTLTDITLEPSIDAGECGHFHITDGKIT